MDQIEARHRARQLAAEFQHKGDTTGWFEEFYKQANGDAQLIAWADLRPNKLFIDWAAQTDLSGVGKTALVVGCGLGDDAEALAQLGFQVTAFDISPTAIEWCKKRFPQHTVNYQIADLLQLPEEWQGHFDFILEIYTLQALPLVLREQAIKSIANCIKSMGELLIICRGRKIDEHKGNMPWPLTSQELALFKNYNLSEVSFEELADPEEPPIGRFRAVYRAD